MTRSTILLFAAAVLAAPAQTNRTKSTRVWFKDGTCVEIYTAASGNAPLFAGGSVNVDSSNTMQRLVLDDHDHALFGYDVEARASSTAGAYSIRIRPLDAARALPAGVFVTAGGHIPTLAAAREFPEVKSGVAVMVDILYNPTTGEKIYDVLRPMKAIDDSLAFEECRVMVNGALLEQVTVPLTHGNSALLHVPGRGDYFLALEPISGHPFEKTGRVERDRLFIKENGETIELLSTGNILKKAESRDIWVYHNRIWSTMEDLLARELMQLRVMLLEKQLNELSKTYQPNHPSIKRIENQLEDLKKTPHKDAVLVTTTDQLEDLIQRRSVQPRKQ